MFDVRTLDWTEWLLRQPGVRPGSTLTVFRDTYGLNLQAHLSVNGVVTNVPNLKQPTNVADLEALGRLFRERAGVHGLADATTISLFPSGG